MLLRRHKKKTETKVEPKTETKVETAPKKSKQK